MIDSITTVPDSGTIVSDRCVIGGLVAT